MKRLFRIFMGVIALLFVYLFGAVRPAAASCLIAAGTVQSGINGGTLTVTAGHSYTLTIQDTTIPTEIVEASLGGWVNASGDGFASGTATAPGSGPYPLLVAGRTTDARAWSLADNTCGGARGKGTVPSLPLFDDGRLNRWDPWETSAIYCLGDGSVRIYVIRQPLWFIAFDASPAEIAKVSKHPTRNTVIKMGHGAGLIRLENG